MTTSHSPITMSRMDLSCTWSYLFEVDELEPALDPTERKQRVLAAVAHAWICARP